MHGQRDGLSYHCWSKEPTVFRIHLTGAPVLIPVIIWSGVHTTKALPWANAHECPWRLPVGSHQPGCALARAVLAMQGGQQDIAGPSGCPHPSVNVAIIQHMMLAIVFSRHKGCPDNNLNTNLASCSWCDTLSRLYPGSMAFLHRIVVTAILAPRF